MHAALNRESVNRPVKTARQQRSDHLARWRIGMNIDRYVQCLGGLKDLPESLIVKIFALGMEMMTAPLSLSRVTARSSSLAAACGACGATAASAAKRSGCVRTAWLTSSLLA